MTKTEDLAQSFRESVVESRPAIFLLNLTLVRAIIGIGIGIMSVGIVLLVLVTIMALAANLAPLNPLSAGIGSLLLALEGFSVVVLSAELID